MVLRLTAERRTGLLLIAAIAFVAWGGSALPQTPVPRFAIVAPIAYFVVILGDIGTAIVLLATWRTSQVRRSTFVLALSFATTGAVMCAAILVLPLLPLEPPVIAATSQAGVWLFMVWHVYAAAGTLCYVFFRRMDSARAPSRRFVTIGIAAAAAALLAVLVLAFLLSPFLPVLANGISTRGVLTSGVGPVTILALLAAAAAALRIRDPNPVERALAISMLSLAAGITLFVAGGLRYTASFYAGRVLVLFGALYVLGAAIHMLVSARGRLAEMEGTLTRVTGETKRQALRIRAVWEIASQNDLADDERFNSILQIATAAIRPELGILGTLSHLDGEQLVYDAVSWTGSRAQGRGLFDGIFPGAIVTFDKTMQSLLGSDGRTTLAWNDLAFLDGRGMLYQQLNIRSFVGSPVMIGRRTHFVTFSSQQSTVDEPFAEDDIAFVDVVAAFLAHRFSQQQQFERLQFQIEHDALTGLENRVQFRKAVREELKTGRPFAVAFVDVDGFRHINEREGHQIADEVLVEIASMLKGARAGDLVARMSADEFGVLLRGVDGIGAAHAALAGYGNVFDTPFHTGDRDGSHVLAIGASIGAVAYECDAATAEALLRRADVALDVAKGNGGSTIAVFDRGMEAMLEESHMRVIELADAIAHDQLDLDYQPTFDLATRRITGAEALVRWNHPERGRLAPAEFIEFAENNGLIAALSRWVFRRAVRDVLTLDAPPGFRVYFNLAALMLDDIPFISELRAVLDADPRLAALLGIEVTETAAMQNVERSMYTIDMFRKWGLTVAIDDFGTGYSSLSYLKRLTVDVIKIDRSFVMGLPGDERDGAITEMLLRITDRFGFSTLAEGIETEEQAAWLLEHGCRYGQGFLVATPSSIDTLRARLEPMHAT